MDSLYNGESNSIIEPNIFQNSDLDSFLYEWSFENAEYKKLGKCAPIRWFLLYQSYIKNCLSWPLLASFWDSQFKHCISALQQLNSTTVCRICDGGTPTAETTTTMWTLRTGPLLVVLFARSQQQQESSQPPHGKNLREHCTMYKNNKPEVPACAPSHW